MRYYNQAVARERRKQKDAGVAELADAQASGACGRKIVWVQVPSPALFFLPKTGVLLKRSSYSIYKTPDLKTASEFRSTMAIISLLKSWIKSAKLANAQTMHF